jgi:hypothetical protein
MKFDKPISKKQWRRLFALSDQIKRLSPWEWMEENQIFGVKNDLAEELGFVSVMGSEGLHHAVTIYKGWGDLERFRLMQEVEDSVVPEFILETSQLMLSFEDRDQLSASDYACIKNLGLSYRGRCAWPRFQAFRPGFFPWKLVNSWEADHMITCLEQSIGVFMRAEDTPELVRPRSDDAMFVRVHQGDASTGEWQDAYLDTPAPERMLTYYEVELGRIEATLEMPLSDRCVEIDYFVSQSPIGGRTERPKCAYVLLITDANTGHVMGSTVLDSSNGLEGVLGQIPGAALDVFEEAGAVPYAMRVSRPVLTQILAPLEQRLGVDIDLIADLPMTTVVRASLEAYMFGKTPSGQGLLEFPRKAHPKA